MTYITAWEASIAPLNAALKAKGIPLIPNYDNFCQLGHDQLLPHRGHLL